MTSPAQELRTAAAKLRALASQTTAGPWTTQWNGQDYELWGADQDARAYPITQWTYAIATTGPKVSEERAECDTANADYIAAMHPGVGTALAELLETEAAVADDLRSQSPDLTDEQLAALVHGPLAVARQILGTDR